VEAAILRCGYPDCGREVKREGWCIFHLPNKSEVEASEFSVQLFAEKERAERDPGIEVIDFRGFIFPPGFMLPRGTEVKKNVNLTKAIFEGIAHFSEVKFSGDALFDGATFSGDAWFGEATFSRDARFGGATFSDVRFVRAVFAGGVFYAGCRFSRFADFRYVKFGDQAVFRREEKDQADPVLIFSSVTFKRPRVVQILGYALSRLSFAMTDVAGILLVPAKGRDERILDEILLERQSKRGLTNEDVDVNSGERDPMDMAWESVGELLSRDGLVLEYKLLRKCMEENRLFTESAHLFVKEMKLSRRRMSWRRDLFEIIAHHLYRLISRYGESINRPVMLSLLAVVGMALLLLEIQEAPMDNFLEYAGAVSSIFLQLKSFNDFRFLSEAPPVLEILTRLASLIFLGNLFITLKRRLERK